MKKIIYTLLLFTYLPLSAQQISGTELLKKSINYHDPKGMWESLSTQWTFTESRPDGSDRQTFITIDNDKSIFKMKSNRDGLDIAQKIVQDKCTYDINGMPPDTAQIRKYRLNCERTQLFRNYYSYLWGLPMKLRDPGTIIHKAVKETTFQDEACYALKVTYEEGTGDDIWYFYINKSDYQLIGYRFFHEESKNDGEYITLEGEVKTNKMRIPKTRKWYYNKDDKYLGADSLNGK